MHATWRTGLRLSAAFALAGLGVTLLLPWPGSPAAARPGPAAGQAGASAESSPRSLYVSPDEYERERRRAGERVMLLDVKVLGSVSAAVLTANDRRDFDDAPERLHLFVRAPRLECAHRLAEALADEGFVRVSVLR